MRHALLRPEDLASEMTVVRNEFERGENDPFDVLLKQSFAVAFREHPYHHPTIGWRDDIENASIERLRALLRHLLLPEQRHPDPGRGVRTRRGARAGRAALRTAAAVARRSIPAVFTREPAQEGRAALRRPAVGRGRLGRRPRGARQRPRTRTPTRSRCSPTPCRRRHLAAAPAPGREQGRCLNVQSIAWQLRDPGLFQVFAMLNQDTAHHEVEEVIREELAAVARDGFTEEELERAQRAGRGADRLPSRLAGPGRGGARPKRCRRPTGASTSTTSSAPARSAATTCSAWPRTYFTDDAISVGYFVPRGNGRDGGGGDARTPAARRRCARSRADCGRKIAPQVRGGGAAGRRAPLPGAAPPQPHRAPARVAAGRPRPRAAGRVDGGLGAARDARARHRAPRPHGAWRALSRTAASSSTSPARASTRSRCSARGAASPVTRR